MSLPYRVNVVSRLNGFGLNRDVELVTKVLEKAGMEVSHGEHRRLFSTWRGLDRSRRFDANIFLERVHSPWLGMAKKNFLIPNQERFPLRHVPLLCHINEVFCKSAHAGNIFSLTGVKASLVGFTSKNQHLPYVERLPKSILHMAGKSSEKGTSEILSLWRQHPGWPTLTLLQHRSKASSDLPDNVNLVTDYQSDRRIAELLNSHQIHLCPSRMEGWGHYIVESLSTGATIVGTNAAPMNEILGEDNAILVRTNGGASRHLGFRFNLDRDDLKSSIQKALTLSSAEHARLGQAARRRFDYLNEQFTREFPVALVRALAARETQSESVETGPKAQCK